MENVSGIRTAARLALTLTTLACVAEARKFYADDPLVREPQPIRVEKARARKISDIYDILWLSFATPGDRARVRARDINTVGEVLEGSWYEKRHGRKRLTLDELKAGPGNSRPPAEGEWTVVSAKSEGITPGFVIEDTAKRRYFLKFDPMRNPEIASAADVIGSKLFHALGYHVPENYIVSFTKDRLRIRPGASFRDERGRKRDLAWFDLNNILLRTPVGSNGRYRASASLAVPGESLGPYRYFGTRADDPNDIVPHEHRRSLRGLHVFSAWVDHDDSRSINTLDTLVDGAIRHHLIDFGSIFGSASSGANSPRSGFEYLFNWSSAAREFLTFGAWVPRWSSIQYPQYPSLGRFSSDRFDPEKWIPEYPNPAFLHRTPEDTLWAAEQVAAFTDEDIRALVSTGEYSDPAAAEYLARTLMSRRDVIVRTYLTTPGAVTDIRLENDRVTYKQWGTSEPMRWQWSYLDNVTGRLHPLPDATGAVPPRTSHEYLALAMTPGNESRRVTVYWRRINPGLQMVGIERGIE